MPTGVKIFIYPVRDLESAKRVFGALTGGEPSVDTPYYVQYDLGDQRIGLDPNGHARGFAGSVGYWEVPDIAAAVEALVAGGAEVHEAAKDVGGGNRIASVKDADGNVIGLIQPA